MRCGCTACVVSAALQLLRVGKVHMAVAVLETLLRSARHKPPRAKPAPRAGKAEGRA